MPPVDEMVRLLNQEIENKMHDLQNDGEHIEAELAGIIGQINAVLQAEGQRLGVAGLDRVPDPTAAAASIVGGLK